MVNTQKLKAAMVRAGYNQESLAKSMDISVNTLNFKLNGKSRITIDEAQMMCSVLGIITDAEKIEIFLA